jgi:hypothetical protein
MAVGIGCIKVKTDISITIFLFSFYCVINRRIMNQLVKNAIAMAIVATALRSASAVSSSSRLKSPSNSMVLALYHVKISVK